MNLIICDQKCRHQQDGYCALNHIAQMTGDATVKCGYFESAAKAPRKKATAEKPQAPVKY